MEGEINYREYIESDIWEKKRQERLDLAGERCELCNRSSNLDVHHRTYERFGGDEKMSDLIVLCRTCHSNFHDRLALHSPPENLPDDAPQKDQSPSAAQEVKDTLETLEATHGEGNIMGIPSGFPKLDDLTSGWQDSDLIIVAARPSMGKTSFTLACAQNAAMHTEELTGVAVFSLEMGREQLVQRMLTSQACVNAHKARTGRMKDDDWQRLARAAGSLSEAEISIHAAPRLSISELKEEARALVRRSNIGLITVDALDQLSIDSESYGGYRQFELRDIVRELKSLAGELNVPVIVTSRLSRGVENRGGDKRPRLIDLPKSDGALESETDMVAFIYRAERYGITVDEQGNSTEGIAEIIIEKQRNGPIGSVELAFVKQYARFEPLTQYDEPGGGPPQGDGSAPMGPAPGGDGDGGNSFEDDAPF